MTQPIDYTSYPPLRNLADVEALEAVPLEDRIPAWDVFELIRMGAARDPAKIAMTYLEDAELDVAPATWTYTELMDRVTRAANLFRASGVNKGETVAYLLPNVPQTFITEVAGLAAGVSFCINWMLEPRQLAAILNASKAKVLVALGPTSGYEIWDKVEAIRAEVPSLTRVFSVTGPKGETVTDSDFDLACDAQRGDRLTFERSVDRNDVAAYVHSGGTTGTPKIARILHRGLAYKCWANPMVMAHTPDEVIFADYPMFHIAGFFGRCIMPFAVGMAILIPAAMGARSKNFIRNYWKLVERYRVSIFSGVPTTLSVLMENPPQGEDLSSLKTYAPTGSAALPVETAKRIDEILGIRMLATFGATEFTQNATQPPRDGDPRYGSTGIHLPYTRVRTVKLTPRGDQIERDCAPDEIGAVLIKGPGVIPGYVDESRNEGLFVDGDWINSGDLGRLDADGYLWLTGRAKDVIIRGGHNIDPTMIEDALLEHGAVRLAAAVSKPDAHAGELPVAYVQLREGASATEDELRDFARARIPERAANPVSLHILDRLPLTDVGKPHKVALRHDAAERAFRDVLAPLVEDGIDVEVSASAHDVHGTLITVALKGTTADRAAVEAKVDALFKPYSLRHETVWRD